MNKRYLPVATEKRITRAKMSASIRIHSCLIQITREIQEIHVGPPGREKQAKAHVIYKSLVFLKNKKNKKSIKAL